jgi:hypothetical protein
MAQTGSPRFLPALAQMVRETDRNARAWVFRAITNLKRAGSGAAGLAPLRVHLTGRLRPSGGSRTLQAAIAAEDGKELPGLPATSIVLWENSRMVADYSVRPLARPASLGLVLVLPLGEAGDRARAALNPLKRTQDRWQECRYLDASLPGTLEQAFAFLATVASDRHMIFVAPPPRNGPPEAGQWDRVLSRARMSAVGVDLVPDSPGDSGRVASACEKAYLMLLCGYEISSQDGAETAEPVETKLEVYAGQSYGVDVLKPGA